MWNRKLERGGDSALVSHRMGELATMGLLQYISPTLQFLLRVFVYREPFDRSRMLAFALIWTAVAIYSASSLRAPVWQQRRYSQSSRPS